MKTEELLVVQVLPGFPDKFQVRVLHHAWLEGPFLTNIIALVETGVDQVKTFTVLLIHQL